VANGDGPWTKYQAQPKQDAQGPWTKYAAPTPASSPIADKSSISQGDKGSFFDPKKLIAGPEGGIGGSPIGNPFDFSKVENYTEEGRKEHPILSRVGDVSRGIKEELYGGKEAGKPMGTTSGLMNNPVTMAMGMAPDVAALGSAAETKLLGGADRLAKVNKILGVTAREIRVGATPETLGEFNSIPSRGVTKYMDEAKMSDKELAKMKPMERLKKVTEFRDAAGAKLDSVLQAASAPPPSSGNALAAPGAVAPRSAKTINVQKVMDETFKNAIPDKALAKLTAKRFQQILDMTGIKTPLSQLSPMEARTLQRALDEYANFAPEGTLKTFRDVATSLRRGISRETGRVVPESVPLDRDYGDLAGATKALRKQTAKYATKPEPSTLSKVAPYVAGAAGLGGAEALYRAFRSP
jgi:hypothetical protein